MPKVPPNLPPQKTASAAPPPPMATSAKKSVKANDVYHEVSGTPADPLTLRNALRDPTSQALSAELVHSITLVEVAFEETTPSVAILEKLCDPLDPKVLAQRLFADAKNPTHLSQLIQTLEANAPNAPKLLAVLNALRVEFDLALAEAAPLALAPPQSITVAGADAQLRAYRLARAAASLGKNTELVTAIDSAHLRYLRAYDSQVLRESTTHMSQATAAADIDPAQAKHHVDLALKQQAYFADMARAAHRNEEAATWELRKTDGQRLRCRLDSKVALPEDIPGLAAARERSVRCPNVRFAH